MNLQNMLKLIRFMEAETVHYNQNTWFSENALYRDIPLGSGERCGTAACLAGSALLACGAQKDIEELKHIVDGKEQSNFLVPKVVELLGWEDQPIAHGIPALFYGGADYWPKPFYGQYKLAKGEKGKRAAAIALLKDMVCRELAARRSALEMDLK